MELADVQGKPAAKQSKQLTSAYLSRSSYTTGQAQKTTCLRNDTRAITLNQNEHSKFRWNFLCGQAISLPITQKTTSCTDQVRRNLLAPQTHQPSLGPPCDSSYVSGSAAPGPDPCPSPFPTNTKHNNVHRNQDHHHHTRDRLNILKLLSSTMDLASPHPDL